ncbi:MAG: helix-turn-helix domain-containing protein [Myxococcota bacterium]
MSEVDPSLLKLFDLLGRRWTLRILVELYKGPTGFRELQARCDSVSSSVLARRLAELVDASIVNKDEQHLYSISKSGELLVQHLMSLKSWAMRWMR